VLSQLVRYGGIAGVAFLIDTGLLLVLSEGMGVNHLVAAAFGFLAGLAVTAALSERYAFSGPRIASPVLRQLVFGLIGLVGLLLLWVSLWFLVDVHGIPLLPAKLLATALVFVWNFLARRALFDNGTPPGTDSDTVDLASR
jgi:putative flippase GtrA